MTLDPQPLIVRVLKSGSHERPSFVAQPLLGVTALENGPFHWGGWTRHRHDPFEGFLPSEIELVVEKLGLVTAGEVGEIVTGLRRDHLGAFDGSSNPFEERDVLLGSVSWEQGD